MGRRPFTIKTGRLSWHSNGAGGQPVRRHITHILRSPRVILIEISAISVACILSTVIPQQNPGVGENLKSATGLAVAVSALGLDHVFSNPFFVGILILSVASLAVTLRVQIRGLLIAWDRAPDRHSFASTPYRAEWVRERRSRANKDAPALTIKSKRRIGLAGSPVLHCGLLVVIIGGALSAIFAVDGVVDMFEGETLAPTHEGWRWQRSRPLVHPLAFGVPVTLETVNWQRYPTGRLRSLNVGLMVGNEGDWRRESVGVNRDLHLPEGRLFVAETFGIAALIAWRNSTPPMST